MVADSSLCFGTSIALFLPRSAFCVTLASEHTDTTYPRANLIWFGALFGSPYHHIRDTVMDIRLSEAQRTSS